MMEIPFIQMGDLHIATPFKNLPQTISQRRRQDIMEAFKAALDMAKARRIPLLFITGDMFENDYITRPVIAEISRLLGTLPRYAYFSSRLATMIMCITVHSILTGHGLPTYTYSLSQP